MAITLVGEVVNSADATGGFNAGNISGDDDFVEGSGAIGIKASGVLQEMFTTTLGATAPYDFSSGGAEEGFHIIMWFNTKTPIQGARPFGGLRILVGNSVDRGHWFVDPFGFYKGGFVTAVVAADRPFDNIAAGAWTLGGNPAQLDDVDRMGGVGDMVTTIMGNFNNFQLDQFTIGEGIRVDDTGNNFEDVRVEDEETNFWGWWSSKNGAFVGKGKLFIGPATGSATADFIDSSQSVVFAAERVAVGFYEFNIRGGGTTVDWTLMNISSALNPRTYDVRDVGFRGATLDVSGDDTTSANMRFRDDGTRVFWIGSQNDNLYQRTLSTAWDLSSAGSASSFDISGDASISSGLWFKTDGSKVFYCDGNTDFIFERTLSTVWDITTAGASSSFDVGADEVSLSCVAFSPDGSRVYYSGTLGVGGDNVRERILSTPWDITSAGALNASFSLQGGIATQAQDIAFNKEGTLMFIMDGGTHDHIAQIRLTTPWDLSTAGTVETTHNVLDDLGTPNGMTFKDDGTRLYMIGSDDNIIVERSLDNNTRWNLTLASDTLSFDDTDGVWSGADHLDLDDSATLLRTTLINCNRMTLNGASLDGINVLDAVRALGESFITANTLAPISDSQFTFSEGHAIEITAPGTYSFVGNVFIGYGPGTASSSGVHDHEFDTITDVDAGADTITISGDPFVTGDPVFYSDDGGTDTIGLTDGNLFYVRRTAANTYQIHLDAAAALTNNAAINLNDGATGEAHSLYSARAAIFNNSGGTVTIQVSGGGSTPSIRNASGASVVTNVENNVAVTISGLRDNTEVRVFADGTTTELAGVENATDGSSDDRSVTFSLTAGVLVDIRFAHGTAADGNVYLVPPANAINDFTWPSSTTDLPVTQIIDRNFDNPA